VELCCQTCELEGMNRKSVMPRRWTKQKDAASESNSVEKDVGPTRGYIGISSLCDVTEKSYPNVPLRW